MPRTEAHIVVNGYELSIGQAMTVRVALTNFLTDLAESGLGKDEVGKTICARYLQAGNDVLKMMGV